MRKLSLDLDAPVPSFRTDEAGEARGTVRASELAVTGVYGCAATCRCPSRGVPLT